MNEDLNKGFMLGVLFLVLLSAIFVSSVFLGKNVAEQIKSGNEVCDMLGYDKYKYSLSNDIKCVTETQTNIKGYNVEIINEIVVNINE